MFVCDSVLDVLSIFPFPVSWFVFAVLVSFFFFFKQKTAYEMCGRDWSSDVCSSDLGDRREGGRRERDQRERDRKERDQRERDEGQQAQRTNPQSLTVNYFL